MLVWTRCAPKLEAEFNRWYDEVHIPCCHARAMSPRSRLRSQRGGIPLKHRIWRCMSSKTWPIQELAAKRRPADARKEMSTPGEGRDMEIKVCALFEPKAAAVTWAPWPARTRLVSWSHHRRLLCEFVRKFMHVMTTMSPASRARVAASWCTTPSCIHTSWRRWDGIRRSRARTPPSEDVHTSWRTAVLSVRV